MKEFTKSYLSYSLAITLFGLKQIDNMVSSAPRTSLKAPAIEALDTVTAAVSEQFGETLTDTFHALDKAQRGCVELMFAFIFSFSRNPSPGATIDLWTNKPGDPHLRWLIKPLAGSPKGAARSPASSSSPGSRAPAACCCTTTPCWLACAGLPTATASC